MNIPDQLAPYAAKLGFPGSEAMTRILAILFDDPASVAVDAVSIDETAIIDEKKCMGCGNCVRACPVEAVTLEEARPPEFIRRT
jgi:ferredoxin